MKHWIIVLFVVNSVFTTVFLNTVYAVPITNELTFAAEVDFDGISFDREDGLDVSNTLPSDIPEPDALIILLTGLFSFSYLHVRTHRSKIIRA